MTQIYKFTFGDFECTVFQDSGAGMSAESIFGTVPEDERNTVLENSPYDPEDIQLSNNIILLERDGQRILFDTGNTMNDPENAQLFPLLEEAGIALNSVNIVALTHAHADHYSGMLDAEGHKFFPNANYVIWQKEWDHYSTDEQMAHELERGQERHDFIKQYFVGLKPHLSFLDEENKSLIDDIQVFPAYGHTRHHVRYEVTSQGKKLHILGDAFLHPLCLDNPHWTFSFEYDYETAIATRRELRNSVADDRVLVYHFPFPGVGHVVQDDGKYSWQSV